MTSLSNTESDQQLLTAAMSAIMGTQLRPSADRSTSQSTVSFLDHHYKTYSYGPIGDSSVTPVSQIGNILVFVKTLTGETFTCHINSNASAIELKNKIHGVQGIPFYEQRIMFAGKWLEDHQRLSDCNIQHESTVHLVLRLQGGGPAILDLPSLDPRYNYDFTNLTDANEEFTRGGMKYVRPCGWRRFAIKVSDKYKDLVWLGATNSPGEWPVSYHGTGLNQAKSIAEDGYLLTKGKRFAYGYGIYSTPDVKVAEKYATKFTHEGHQYLVVLQNRVNPTSMIKVSADRTGVGEYWINSSEKDVRPYGFCVRKV